MNTAEAFNEIKAYLNHLFGDYAARPTALTYTSTSGYLRPLLEQVETKIKELDKLESVKGLCESLSCKPFYKKWPNGRLEKVYYPTAMGYRILYDIMNNCIAVLDCDDLWDTLSLGDYGRAWALSKEELE